jgi:hypothetical protein
MPLFPCLLLKVVDIHSEVSKAKDTDNCQLNRLNTQPDKS